MTRKQFDQLVIGDLVTTYTGPNKGIAMKVARKYITPGGSPAIVAEGVNEKDYIYSRKSIYRDGHHTSGRAASFRLIREQEYEKIKED